jgi:hypothetical protein
MGGSTTKQTASPDLRGFWHAVRSWRRSDRAGHGCRGRMGTTEADGEPRSSGGEPGREGVVTEVPGEAWSAGCPEATSG